MQIQRSAWLASVSAVGAMVCVAVPAQAQTQTYDVNIRAQDMGDALRAFGRQTRQQVVFSGEAVRGLRSAAVRGRIGAREALERIVAGSGLTIDVGAGGVYMIRRGEAGQTSAAINGERPQTDNGSAPVTDENAGREIVVTGTNIRGAAPVGSDLKVYTKEDLRRRGVSTVEQFLRQLPENAATVDAATSASGFLAQSSVFTARNVTKGTEINIHGVGSGATLVLLDGNRLSPGGSDGSLVDVSLIPAAALERVEILTDGASAIYGADAVAGVVNFITRRDYSGLTTSFRAGTATEGGGRELVADVAAGVKWNGGNALLSYEYFDGEPISYGQRSYARVPSIYSGARLYPGQKRNSVFGRLRQDLGPQVSADLSGYFSDRRYGDTQSVNGLGAIDYSGFAQAYGANLNLEYAISDGFSLRTNLAYAATDERSLTSAAIFNSLGSRFSRNYSGDVRIDGPIVTIGGGDVRVAAGAQIRREEFRSAQVSSGTASTPYGTISPRTVKSVFGEVIIPVIGVPNASALISRLEVSAAARYDDFTDAGSGLSPKVGVALSTPFGLRLRGTYARSFRAPPISLAGSAQSYQVLPLPDPQAASGTTNAILDTSGSNPNIGPERASSWSFGFDFTPPGAQTLTVSATYFRHSYRDRIAKPAVSPFFALQQPAAYAGLVTRNPSLALVQSYYARTGFLPTAITPAQVGAIVDYRFTNIATSLTEGIDFRINFNPELSFGELSLLGSGTKLLRSRYQTNASAPAVSAIDGVYLPDDFKAYGSATMSSGGFSATFAVNYVSGYESRILATPERVSSWTTFDLNAAYRFGPRQSARPLTLSVGARNLFDRKPPLFGVGSNLLSNFDAVNASAIGRFLYLQITKQW